MSLVSCVMAKMQGDMGTSDCEDKAANLTAKIKSIGEQGADIGKMLSNLEGNIGDVTSKLRECNIAGYRANYDQNFQQYLPQIDSDIANLQNQLSQMAQEKISMEADKRSYAAEERELQAEQTKNDMMMKLHQGAAQKFGGMVDGAIKRFFGGGGQG